MIAPLSGYPSSVKDFLMIFIISNGKFAMNYHSTVFVGFDFKSLFLQEKS